MGPIARLDGFGDESNFTPDGTRVLDCPISAKWLVISKYKSY